MARRKLSWRNVRRNPVIRPRPGSDLDRVRTTKQIIHIADMQVGGAATTAIVELAGARTFLNVPMLKDDELIGTIGIYSPECPALYRQADRTGQELCRPGRHRHREHAAAQRTARIAPAADRDRRGAASDQQFAR